MLRRTDRRFVDLSDDNSMQAATDWWHSLTEEGGEGMVVKPAASLVQATGSLVLPGVKCRGRDYLRIIYGPEYLEPSNLERLRQRSLGRKRSLAQRESALGIEALDRFVANEHLSRVHECVFACWRSKVNLWTRGSRSFRAELCEHSGALAWSISAHPTFATCPCRRVRERPVNPDLPTGLR